MGNENLKNASNAAKVAERKIYQANQRKKTEIQCTYTKNRQSITCTVACMTLTWISWMTWISGGQQKYEGSKERNTIIWIQLMEEIRN